MRCFVKISERYEEEAQRHGCTLVVQRFKRDVERTLNYDHNRRDVYGFGEYLRKEHKNFRSIYAFKVLDINNQEIRCYVALRVFKRGDQEYERFINTNLSASERERITGENLIDWTKYEAEIAGELKEKPEEEILQKLEGVEKTYIQRQCGVTQKIFDTSIFESKYWLDAIRNDDFNDHYKVAEALSNHIINATVKNAYGILDVPYGEKKYDDSLCSS